MAAPSVVPTRWEDIFRGYDIRGRYPSEIDPETARRVGWALGRALPGPFLLGRDTRRESVRFSLHLSHGLRSSGARVRLIGVVPTPEVAFLAGRREAFGLAVTPSHNPLGYVGLKGFGPTGQLFDSEWQRVAEVFRKVSRVPPAGNARARSFLTRTKGGSDSSRELQHEYMVHVTQGLATTLSVVVDTRGGATAWAAPAALRRIGAQVVGLTNGFSPYFFGRSPEPRPETLTALSDRVTRIGADVGFAFDGDGDRCVVVDEHGRPTEPEAIALLLHRTFADPRSPIVASADASRELDRRSRTVRSRVGGRFVARTMERTGAEVGVEPSGHYYVRRYGADSDGILIACLVCHALGQQKTRLGDVSRRFGRLHRGSSTVDYGGVAEARDAFEQMVRALGKRARAGLDGVTVEFPEGWCLVRPSNTQPSIRFAYEALGPAPLRRIRQAVLQLARTGSPSARPVASFRTGG